MKKKHILGVSICLLLSCVSTGNATPESDEDDMDTEAANLPPLKLLNSFCAFKADEGPCRAHMIMYYFNFRTRKCEEFVYGGCEGNQNRFDTQEECEEQCINGNIDICSLEEDPGICRGFFTRYFYNNQTKQCEKFIYGGCLGNANNFESLEECKNTCQNQLTVSGSKGAVRNEGITTRPVSYKVIKIRQRTKIPRRTKAPIVWEYLGPSLCKSPADRGLCRANETRFYYDFDKRQCFSFSYTGCGGNDNNFVLEEDCLKVCLKGFKIKRRQGLIKTRRKKQHVTVEYEQATAKN